ncbi:hypothetical protein ACQ27_gp648 [Klebsiella phage K64-1]|nr:hypothetical protein ACQ27_gp648 [Klebsiella phage K64-1]
MVHTHCPYIRKIPTKWGFNVKYCNIITVL